VASIHTGEESTKRWVSGDGSDGGVVGWRVRGSVLRFDEGRERWRGRGYSRSSSRSFSTHVLMSSSDGAIAWSWRWARRLDAVRSWALHNGPTDSDFGTDFALSSSSRTSPPRRESHNQQAAGPHPTRWRDGVRFRETARRPRGTFRRDIFRSPMNAPSPGSIAAPTRVGGVQTTLKTAD
jgi:hypothetical protein